MLNKKKVAAITAVGIHLKSLKTSRKVSWGEYRVGWAVQPRLNWNKN